MHFQIELKIAVNYKKPITLCIRVLWGQTTVLCYEEQKMNLNLNSRLTY